MTFQNIFFDAYLDLNISYISLSLRLVKKKVKKKKKRRKEQKDKSIIMISFIFHLISIGTDCLTQTLMCPFSKIFIYPNNFVILAVIIFLKTMHELLLYFYIYMFLFCTIFFIFITPFL